MTRRIMLAALATAALTRAETFQLKTIADTWIEVPEFGRFKSAKAALPGHGTDRELIVKGREALALLQFDTAPAKGITVTRATLRLYRRPDRVPLHTVGLSTVSGSGLWSEAAAGFRFARQDRGAWSYEGSDIIDVTYGQGGSLYSYQRARDAGEGWWEVDVPPAIVHALVTGGQFGLMLSDEKGQTGARHAISSREGEHPPTLIVEGERTDHTAPGRARAIGRTGSIAASTVAQATALGRTSLAPGTAIVRFGGAGDDGGRGVATRYELRYSEAPVTAANFDRAASVPRWRLDPLAPKAHPMATANSLRDEVTAVVEGLKPGQVYYFAARATDEAGNVGPVSALGQYRAFDRRFPELPQAASVSQKIEDTGSPVWAVPELWKIDPRTGAVLEAGGRNARGANPVWDAAAGTVRLQGARNEFVAFQIAIEGRSVSGVKLAVTRPIFAGNKLPPIFASGGAIQLYREWFVPDDKQTAEPRPWYPDALIPLDKPLDIPAPDNGVSGQTVQPVFVDIYIPHDARPGTHTAQISVTGGGIDRNIPITLEVLPFTLPDKLSFIVDLNCYSGVNSGWNVRRGTPEYRALEVAYHRLAHLNRANLDVLGYSHTGSVVEDHTPGLSGEGAATRITDWSAWDAHFGPVLGGSAFRDLPRAGVPVPALYLPFFENWPGDLRASYRFNNYPIAKTEEEFKEIITRHALEAAPVEESFSADYQERFSAVAAQFADHLKQRGWLNTRYLVYFNDKYYYKRPSMGGRGVSWWLMDEPNHRDDVRANSFLSYLLKRGTQKFPDVPITLRTDISRVEWLRDLMAGQIDLDCISPHFYSKNRYLLNDRRRFGRDYWNYASTNHPRDTNVAMRSWCWRVWLHGGNGVVPWNTVRGAEAWDRAEPLTVFYTGRKFGKDEPFASVRLKAFRRGQQDIEYLTLLANQAGWGRDAVIRAVAPLVDVSATVQQADEEDAGSMKFGKAADEQFEAALRRVAKAIGGGAGR